MGDVATTCVFCGKVMELRLVGAVRMSCMGGKFDKPLMPGLKSDRPLPAACMAWLSAPGGRGLSPDTSTPWILRMCEFNDSRSCVLN